MNFIKKIVKKLLDDDRIARAKLEPYKAHIRKKDDALLARIGINRTAGSGPTNKKRIILHSIVAFALFAGIFYWLIAVYFEKGRKPSYGAVLLPWLASIGYLVVVYFFRKKRQ
jgi:hypothetical protein